MQEYNSIDMTRQEELYMPPDYQVTFPIFNSQQISSNFRAKIENIIELTHRTTRINLTSPKPIHRLFTITNGKEMSVLTNLKNEPIGIVDQNLIQNIISELLKEFGFDQNVYIKNPEENFERRDIDLGNEELLFPSQTIAGLAFRQLKTYHPSLGLDKPYSVSLYVLDTTKDIKIKGRGLFDINPSFKQFLGAF